MAANCCRRFIGGEGGGTMAVKERSEVERRRGGAKRIASSVSSLVFLFSFCFLYFISSSLSHVLLLLISLLFSFSSFLLVNLHKKSWAFLLVHSLD